jgi:hypothetical protein
MIFLISWIRKKKRKDSYMVNQHILVSIACEVTLLPMERGTTTHGPPQDEAEWRA